MAHLTIECHDNRVTIRSQAFWCEFLDTWANRKVLFVIVRALRSPETGKPLVTYQELAEGFAYSDRRNVQNFWQEFEACEADFEAYLRRKRKVDVAVVAAVTEEVRQAPLESEAVLRERVSARLGRDDLSSVNIHAALAQVPCTVVRSRLRRDWEAGRFHPKEAVVLQDALAVLQQTTSEESQRMGRWLEDLGITAGEVGTAGVMQRQQADGVRALLNPTGAVAAIPERMRLMVMALTLYFWNVPLSRLGLWLGVSKSTVYAWVIGLAVALFPVVQAWVGAGVKAVTVAIDEKWLKLRQQWYYWFVVLDEETTLPILWHVLPTRTTWACCWVLVTLKRLRKRPHAVITDGLAGYAAALAAVFPTATHLTCLFHHQQGVGRWFREHAVALPGETVAHLTRLMKRVVQTWDSRTVRRRLTRLAVEDTTHQWGIHPWLTQTHSRLGQLLPAVRRNTYPRTTNAIERFFRAFQRFYKTRGGFHSVRSAKRELMLFVVVYVFTIQVSTGIAPIERIVPQANQMPFYKLLNDPFRYGLANRCQAKRNGDVNMATQQGSLQLKSPC
jgi:transposase-like protein